MELEGENWWMLSLGELARGKVLPRAEPWPGAVEGEREVHKGSVLYPSCCSDFRVAKQEI